MKVLFARVGYMKFYQGPKPDDEKPIGGGSYNTEKVGHEAYNFLQIDGNLYGYFQPHMQEPYEITLERIEQGYTSDKLDNVLVIWFATNPIEKGQVVVGWYNNATVFRSVQTPKSLSVRENYNYNIRASMNDAVLLPISKRKYTVGHSIQGTKMGNPGHANVFYLLDENGNEKDLNIENNAWISSLVKYVQDYNGPAISSKADEIQENVVTAEYSTGGQGFQSDVEVRLKIESYSMAVCIKNYEDKGYTVKDVSKTRSYDLHIMKNGSSQMIEVKGTQGDVNTIILTKNEVELSKESGGKMALFIVHSIIMNKKTVKKGSGTIFIVEPWDVLDDQLTPISYMYKLS